ncbi:Utp21 specific WD40 associated putative domain-containing protein [Lipomyces oligophaga]|uniref:Utp21 specific WD40 associated putative domain-containing protein n=1 Tax=Lipomyces oligophaga TaxID=45792 RepID=UPI0034CEBF64
MPAVVVSGEPMDSSKRRKLESAIQKSGRRKHASRIFSPFRALGHVTSSVPFSVSTLGQTFIVTTVVGNSFQIYDAATLRLLFVSSPQTSSPITAISTHFHHVYAIWGTTLGVFRRGKLQYSVESESPSPFRNLLVFGDYICVSSEESIYVFRFSSSDRSVSPELYTSIDLPLGSGSVISLDHLHTYLNKIIVTTSTYVFLYNIRTGLLVFQSQPFEAILTAVDVAPVLDTVGLAFEDGSIQAYNIRFGKILFELNCKQKVTSISFRTDGTAQLAAATAEGDIYFYDLNRQRRISIMRDVHSDAEGGVSCISFLNGQPVFLTSGGDNYLKEFVFDPEVTTSTAVIPSPPRHLRSRGGHSKPSKYLYFTDESGHFLLSASLDRSLWMFSLRKDAQSHEISQREKSNGNGRRPGMVSHMREKFPEIISMAFEANRQGDWENIITAHKGLAYARTWDSQKGIVGRWRLKTSDKGTVRSVAISFCGNFGLIGSAHGTLDIYNLQSGIHRKRLRSHKRAVTGIAVDNINQNVVTCSVDQEVHFIDFKTMEVKNRIQLPAAVNALQLHRTSGLFAVSLDNNQIFVIDMIAARVVRELKGHSDRITTFDFSADGRWIVSAARDYTVRTWDLPTGICIDAVRFQSIVTSLRLSGTGEWLATAHEDNVGINLWANRTLFKAVNFRQISESEIAELEMPTISGEGSTNILENALGEESEDEDVSDLDRTYVSAEQISPQLVTLSTLPRSRFSTLVHLDVIRQRNKPKEAPKVPENAPFFLTLTGSEADGEQRPLEAKKQRKKENSQSALLERSTTRSEFEQKLVEGHSIDEYSDCIEYLKILTPSMTDLEIRSLQSDNLDKFIYFIEAMTQHLRTRRDYEAVQAWMAMFLKIHSDVLLKQEENSDVMRAIEEWKLAENNEKKRLDELLGYCAGVIQFLRLE